MGDPTYTGRTAVPRDESGRTAVPRGLGGLFGNDSPRPQHFPVARMTNFHILSAEDSNLATAISDLGDAFDAWIEASAQERAKIVSVTFEHYGGSGSDHGFLMFIVYSK